MNKSAFLSLNWQDVGKGLVVAVLTAVLSAIIDVIGDGSLPTAEEWKHIAGIAVTAGGGYLLKNVLSNSNGQPLKTEASAVDAKQQP